MSDNKIINFEQNLPHRTAEIICLRCLHRYQCVWPEEVLLKNLGCEKCGPGYIILTGQSMEEK